MVLVDTMVLKPISSGAQSLNKYKCKVVCWKHLVSISSISWIKRALKKNFVLELKWKNELQIKITDMEKYSRCTEN